MCDSWFNGLCMYLHTSSGGCAVTSKFPSWEQVWTSWGCPCMVRLNSSWAMVTWEHTNRHDWKHYLPAIFCWRSSNESWKWLLNLLKNKPSCRLIWLKQKHFTWLNECRRTKENYCLSMRRSEWEETRIRTSGSSLASCRRERTATSACLRSSVKRWMTGSVLLCWWR